METQGNNCPKCGGSMIPGVLKYESETYNSAGQNPLMAKSLQSQLPGVYERADAIPYWEEKTGQKTGFIWKTDEYRILKLKGFRCSICGYVELYTILKDYEES